MTSFSDQLKLGGAQYAPATATTSAGYVIGYSDLENTGVPVAPVYYYAITTPSTSLASGIVYITTSASGTLTATGPLVSSGVATLDFPRALRITATTNISAALITIRGTDGYGQAMTWTGIGPTGNTAGTTGSFVITNKAFKTVTTASISAAATGGIQIGTSDTYGLPYRISATNKVVGVYVDGFSFGSSAGTVTAGFSATGAAHTASGTDVRGLVALPTAVLANDTRNYTIGIISPSWNVSASTNESTVNTYGATQYSA